ncbi:Uncharacterized protein dnl_49190 [Desulfonema limicola]|uniref:DUF4347 domain-containing protein n=1 Tax=Desulfonema limicola TaxID=45656 RepID=A0A975GIF8_9BACT|nr:DUF4347 domain-containing protein [Desulfonema limicola]QTA82542.1 Uncharacterized protein dnl_49190 [Desulfonema limicola]
MLNLIKLENRIVLDGAGIGEALGHAADHDAQVSTETHVPDHVDEQSSEAATIAGAAALLAEYEAHAETVDIVLVSDSLPEYQTLIDAAKPESLVIVYDADAESAADVINRVTEAAEQSGQTVNSLTILSHGGSGYFNLGKENITAENLDENSQAWSALKEVMAQDGNIYVYGCSVANGTGDGQVLLNGLASATGADVFASDDTTGNGGDWDLEAASDGADQDAAPPLIFEHLADYEGSLTTISIPTAMTSLEDQPGTFGIFIYGTGENATSRDADSVDITGATPSMLTNVNIRYEGWITNQPRVIDGVNVSEYHRWAVDYDPVKDAFSNDGVNNNAVLNFDVEGSPFSTTVTLLPVNDAPDFNINEDKPEVSIDEESGLYKVTVKEDGGEDGLITISDFAEDIIAGPANESNQNVKFIIDSVSNPGLFDVQPAVSPAEFTSLGSADGTLTFKLKENAYGTTIVSVKLQDDGGTENGGINTSVIRQFIIEVEPVPDIPDDLEYTENGITIENCNIVPGEGGPTLLEIALGTDDDDIDITKVVVEITDGYQNDTQGKDVLLSGDMPSGISAQLSEDGRIITFTAADGTSAKIGAFQKALDTVGFEHIGGNADGNDPIEGNRTIKVSVTDTDTPADEASVGTGTIFVDAINDAPVFESEDLTDNSLPALSYSIRTSPVNILDGIDDLDIADADDTMMTEAVIHIENYTEGDVLSFVDTADIKIDADKSTSDTLVLTGTATKEAYIAALKAVTYSNPGSSAGPQKDITITVTDNNSDGTGSWNPGGGEAKDCADIGPGTAVLTRTILLSPAKPVFEDVSMYEDNDNPGSIVNCDYEKIADYENGIAVSDLIASPIESVAVTAVDNSNGTWMYTTGDGTTEAEWKAVNDGQLSDTHALLLKGDDRLKFVPNADFNTDRDNEGMPSSNPSFTVRAWDTSIEDSGTAGTYGDVTASTIAFSMEEGVGEIKVVAVNDRPDWDISSPLTISETDENGYLTVIGTYIEQDGTASISGVAITDVDIDEYSDEPSEDTGKVEVTLSVEHGTMLIGKTDKIEFVSGDKNTPSAKYIIKGDLEEVNTAINSIIYTADSGSEKIDDNLVIEADDLNNFGQGNACNAKLTINIAGIKNPVIDLDPDDDGRDDNPDGGDPGDSPNFNTVFIEGCGPVPIADSNDPDDLGKMITDHDSDNLDSLTVTIINATPDDVLNAVIPAGYSINISQYTYDSQTGQGVLILSGRDTIAHYEDALRSITYENSSENPVPETRQINVVAVDEDGNASTPVTSRVTVFPVNDAPVNTFPNEFTAAKDSSLILEGVTVSDPDILIGNGTLQVTISAGYGTITVTTLDTGAAIENNNTGEVIIDGTLEQINAALVGLTYTPMKGFVGDDVLRIETNDQGYSGIGTVTDENGNVINSTDSRFCNIINELTIEQLNALKDAAASASGSPDSPHALTDSDSIPINVIESHIKVVPTGPETPNVPFLPITRGEGEGFDGILGEAVRFPGPVGLTEGEGRPLADMMARSGEEFFDFCSIEEALRPHLGCRFANTKDTEAQFSAVRWSDLTDLGWTRPYLDEEFDLYTRLFLRQEGDPGFNIDAGAFGVELGGQAIAKPQVFRDSGAEDFNDIGPGGIKKAFFAGREHLDKTGR